MSGGKAMTDLRKSAENILKVLDGKPELLVSWLERLKEAREELRQALAQPEQELVGYVTDSGRSAYFLKGVDLDDDTPLYTAPPKREWVGLTDEEMSELANKYKHIETGWYHDMALIAEAEAKLKEKNT
jgi:uncharacterized UPF0160 family protein